jgi:RNA polymerase sigma-70 factor (ECF subfamily)
MNAAGTRVATAWIALQERVVALTPGASGDLDDVLRAAHGDAAAFERVYRRHNERIHALARRMVGPDDADDAVQDIFFRAWARLQTYRAGAAFSTWLHRLALNVLIRRGSRVRRIETRTVGISEERLVAAAQPFDAQLDLDSALAALSPDLRAAVVLHDIEGYSHEEIGELLGISLAAARMRLYRARIALRAFGTRR